MAHAFELRESEKSRGTGTMMQDKVGKKSRGVPILVRKEVGKVAHM